MCRMISFRRCSKGFSTVIGTIFLVLIALTVASSVFLYTFAQNAAYNQAVKESSQMDAERYSERIVAYDTEYNYFEGVVTVNTTIAAQGPLSAQIIRIWVTWTPTVGAIKYNSQDVEISVPSGQTIRGVEMPVSMSGASNAGVFEGWLITARGNRVPLEQKEEGEQIIVADVAQGIGSISMDFTDFEYFRVNNGFLGQSSSAFELPSGVNTVLAVTLTNYDPLKRTITLYGTSMLWVYFPTAPGNPGKWSITNINEETGAVLGYVDNIVLDYKETARIYFGVGTVQVKNVAGAVNLILLGTLGDDDYGQNIPFVSIFITA